MYLWLGEELSVGYRKLSHPFFIISPNNLMSETGMFLNTFISWLQKYYVFIIETMWNWMENDSNCLSTYFRYSGEQIL